jgi:hypothetical protein
MKLENNKKLIIGAFLIISLVLSFKTIGKIKKSSEVTLDNSSLVQPTKFFPVVTQKPSPLLTNEPIPTEEPTPTPKKINYRIAGTWVTDFGGETWKAVVIPKGTSREDVVNLARDIHAKDPETYYEIFDDATELAAYIKWSKSDNARGVYFPEDWVMDHSIGMINKMLTTYGTRWQFSSDHSDYLGSEYLE